MDTFYGWVRADGGIFWVGGNEWTIFKGGWVWMEIYFWWVGVNGHFLWVGGSEWEWVEVYFG